MESPKSQSDGLCCVTPEMDRSSGNIFFISYFLSFLAVPVTYIDVVQAALCHKLGASATVANLPAAAYFLGAFAPIFLAWMIPLRFERAALVGTTALSALVLGIVCLSLVLPATNSVRIGTIILQGLVMGVSATASMIYLLQCLARGTTLNGRTRAFQRTFAVTPLAAVAGSLGAQFVLNRGIPFLSYPYDFAFLYFIGFFCVGVTALMSTRFKLVPVSDEPRVTLKRYLIDSVKGFTSVKYLVFLWLAYALWYSTFSSLSNLALYAKLATGREPSELSGLMNALRFGSKSLAGWTMGTLAARWGIRAPLIACVLFLGIAVLWAWMVPGYLYLFAFGLMGAGQLGGAYFPNYISAVSSPSAGTRNLSLLTLATPVASLSAALHGVLTDHFGFRASFGFGCLTAGVALWLIMKVPSRPSPNLAG